MKILRVIIFCVIGIIIILGLIVGYFLYKFNYSKTSNSSKVEFEIKSGERTQQIAENLNKENIYLNPIIFRAYLLYSNKYSKVQAGDYLINPNISLNELSEMFVKGKVNQNKVTIREGLRLTQIADYLAKKNIVSKDEFSAELSSGLYKKNYPEGYSGQNLEGLLFPDTYYLKKNVTSKDVISIMLDNLKKRTNNYQLLQNSTGLNEYQTLILASIVEREAKTFENRKLAASVFLNRLKINMKLESNATVEYAKSDYWEKLSNGDSRNIISAYNTYLNSGLPPTPICSPSLESIQAIADAPQTDYYYFISAPDGKMYFAKTVQEHNANVAKYL